jgi:two-component system chemotaxis response regulator CheY
MKRILIVDDAATVRMFHRKSLKPRAMRWTRRSMASRPWRRPCRAPFDLYVVDVNMPKLDGYGFLRELRGQDIPQAPAIMISTEAAADDQKLAYASGANAYLIKPSKPIATAAARAAADRRGNGA